VSEAKVTEISSQSGDERLFRVIAGERTLQFGTEKRTITLNMRSEILEAVGINTGDAMSAEKPFLLARWFKVIPEQWRDEYKNAREFMVEVKYE
jgi:hypothetical protein